MKKTLGLIIVCVMAFSSLTACGKEQDKKDNAKPSMNIDIKGDKVIHNGTAQRTFQVKEGGTVDVGVAITNHSGTLNVTMWKDDDKKDTIYVGEDVQTSNFTVSTSEAGNYTIWIEAKDFDGDYNFTICNK